MVTDFSLWSITGSTEPPPVIFRVDDMRISPVRLDEVEAVTIGATVTNLLGERAEYIAVLWLNAALNSSQTLVLKANESADVEFLLRPKKGDYEARIDRLAGGFVVEGEGLGIFLWIIIVASVVLLGGGSGDSSSVCEEEGAQCRSGGTLLGDCSNYHIGLGGFSAGPSRYL